MSKPQRNANQLTQNLLRNETRLKFAASFETNCHQIPARRTKNADHRKLIDGHLIQFLMWVLECETVIPVPARLIEIKVGL